MARQSSFGLCALCNARVGKAAMGAHVRKCLVALDKGQATSPVLLARVEAPGTALYWLDVAVKPDAKLRDLDGLRRRIWLECCGHLSEFCMGKRRTVGMGAAVGKALGAIGGTLEYVYDFGSSTELRVRLTDVVQTISRKKIQVVARNEPPTWACDVCGQPATSVCGQCLYDEGGFCCPAHESSHGCGDELLLPVVNSPRMGVCGYAGEV